MNIIQGSFKKNCFTNAIVGDGTQSCPSGESATLREQALRIQELAACNENDAVENGKEIYDIFQKMEMTKKDPEQVKIVNKVVDIINAMLVKTATPTQMGVPQFSANQVIQEKFPEEVDEKEVNETPPITVARGEDVDDETFLAWLNNQPIQADLKGVSDIDSEDKTSQTINNL